MRIPPFRPLAVLVLGIAAATLHVAGVASPAAASAFADERLGLGADSPDRLRNASASLPIYVDMECQSAGGGVHTCQASAGGGSGAGFSYTWSNSNGSTWESYDQDGYSEADVACYGGLGQGSTATVTATATDSNGATGSKSRIINCGY